MDPLKAQTPHETKLHFLDYWRIIRIRKTVILAVFFLVVITATLVTFILQPQYSSVARIRVQRDVSDIQGGLSLSDRSYGTPYDPYFIQTEYEVIQSEVVLGKVIDQLHLEKVWGEKFNNGVPFTKTMAIKWLKGRLDVRPVRNTSLIEIRVYSEDKDEAAKLANTIADVYRQHRLDQRREMTLGGVETLQQQYNDMDGKIRKVQAELYDLRQKDMISDLDPAGTSPTPLLSSDTVRQIQAAQVNNRTTLIGLEARLDKLKSLKHEELKEVLPRVMQDPILNELISQLNTAEQTLVVLKKDKGPDHPDVIRAQSLVNELTNKIDRSVTGFMDALETQVDSARAQLKELDQTLEKAKETDIEQAKKSRDYFDKKRELNSLLTLRQAFEMRIASEKLDEQLPKTTMVEIVERAVPSLKPVRPNKPLNIFLGVVIGLVVGVGLAFFIEYLDTSVKTIDDVERTLQSPVLGVIPQNVGHLLEEGAESPHAEAYRVLRTNVLFSRKDDKLNTIAVVSAGAGEGKSTTVLNLATVFAQSGQRVLIVDSDLRRPTLHKMLGVSNSLGLTNYLLKQNTLEEVIQTTAMPSMDFLASGKLPSSSLGILSSTHMKDLIAELKKGYDFVFFDSPPIMGVSDASILASVVDLTLQVIQYRRYPQPMNIRAKQLIEKVGGNLTGIVLNNINMSQDEGYYYYSGYYHDYYSKNEESAETTPERKDASSKDKAGIQQKR
jgi:polysaccharide biosynthesis transport protein